MYMQKTNESGSNNNASNIRKRHLIAKQDQFVKKHHNYSTMNILQVGDFIRSESQGIVKTSKSHSKDNTILKDQENLKSNDKKAINANPNISLNKRQGLLKITEPNFPCDNIITSNNINVYSNTSNLIPKKKGSLDSTDSKRHYLNLKQFQAQAAMAKPQMHSNIISLEPSAVKNTKNIIICNC